MKILPNSWQASLQQLLNRPSDSRIALVGIGNTLRSDDAVGILVVRALQDSRLIRDRESILVIDAGNAPENCTADLRRFAPGIVLLIDAVDMGETPGSIRLIEMNEIDGMSASTHSLPLSILASYLSLELGCDLKLIGIQVKSNEVGDTVNSDVRLAAKTLVDVMLQLISIP